MDASNERATGIEPADASVHRRNEVGALLLVPPHQRMSFYLETRRLIMRPWVQSDSEGYRALGAERGRRMPTATAIRENIASQLSTPPPPPDDRGELVWLTRTLPGDL